MYCINYFFFSYCCFNDPTTTRIYTYLHTLSLHDALPILLGLLGLAAVALGAYGSHAATLAEPAAQAVFETAVRYHFAHLPGLGLAALLGTLAPVAGRRDRKSTRLNSSH